MAEHTPTCRECGAALDGRDVYEGICTSCREEQVLGGPPLTGKRTRPPGPVRRPAAPSAPAAAAEGASAGDADADTRELMVIAEARGPIAEADTDEIEPLPTLGKTELPVSPPPPPNAGPAGDAGVDAAEIELLPLTAKPTPARPDAPKPQPHGEVRVAADSHSPAIIPLNLGPVLREMGQDAPPAAQAPLDAGSAPAGSALTSELPPPIEEPHPPDAGSPGADQPAATAPAEATVGKEAPSPADVQFPDGVPLDLTEHEDELPDLQEARTEEPGPAASMEQPAPGAEPAAPVPLIILDERALLPGVQQPRPPPTSLRPRTEQTPDKATLPLAAPAHKDLSLAGKEARAPSPPAAIEPAHGPRLDHLAQQVRELAERLATLRVRGWTPGRQIAFGFRLGLGLVLGAGALTLVVALGMLAVGLFFHPPTLELLKRLLGTL